WRVSASFSVTSSAFRPRTSLAFKEIALPLHELAADRELLRGEAHGLARQRLRDAGKLEHDPARLDHGHPELGRPLAGAHAGLERLLRHGLVGEDVDPHLAAAADLAGHRDTGGLDLAAGDPALLERLQPVLAEVDPGPALGEAGAAAAEDAAVLDPAGKQHQPSPPSSAVDPPFCVSTGRS